MVFRVLCLGKRSTCCMWRWQLLLQSYCHACGVTEKGEIRRLCVEFIERHPYVFQPFLFTANSVREHVKKRKLTGTWTETVDIFRCATLLQHTVFTFSLVRQQWLKFEQLFNTCTSNNMSANKVKRCLCPISLLLV